MKITAKSLISFLFVLALSMCLLTPVYAANSAEAETKAQALKTLGLFQGVSDTDFALNRAPTRTEAMIMLIRTLGKETEALNGTWTHPFTDVDAWADNYVGYAYSKGLTMGISATEFGKGNADADMYLTFMLRALNYSDTEGDFVWNEPNTLAAAVGILPSGVDTTNFLRSDVSLISWAALQADLKTGSLNLAKKLIADNIFTNDAYANAIAIVAEPAPSTISVSSYDTLKTALASGSYNLITVDSIGTPVIISGELTIPAGVTVTVNRGNDFYVESTLTNNGTLNILGADSIRPDFINYSVLAVQNNGKLINNGAINLAASSLPDLSDNGPIGGQLRLFSGEVINRGSIFLKAGNVNTHGGMLDVIGGSFSNEATIILDGFFLRVSGGAFLNSSSGILINNCSIFVMGESGFSNLGTLTGHKVNE